jgi:hypothetical protein
VRWPDEARLSGKQTSTRRLGSMTRRSAAKPIGRTRGREAGD